MKLSDARSVIANAVNHIAGITTYEHRPTTTRPGDGWPVLRRVEPSTFGTCRATFDLLVLLSSDEQSAEDAHDDVALDLIDGLGRAGLTPVSLTPISLNLGGSEMFALAASVLLEVEH